MHPSSAVHGQPAMLVRADGDESPPADFSARSDGNSGGAVPLQQSSTAWSFLSVPHDDLSKQVSVSVGAVAALLILLLLAVREVDEGQRWHSANLQAAKYLSADAAEFEEVLYTAHAVHVSREPGDLHTLGDDEGRPIDHWLAGEGGEAQAQAAWEDLHPQQRPTPLVHLPERPYPEGLPDPSGPKQHDSGTAGELQDRQEFHTLDFQRDNVRLQSKIAAEAAALEREMAVAVPKPLPQTSSVEVKKLMTSKSFRKWKKCVDYYGEAKATANMMQVMENGDLGSAPNEVASAFSNLARAGCVFFTKNCVSTKKPELLPGYYPKSKQSIAVRLSLFDSLPPSLPRKALGSCALVGHSSRVMAEMRGAEIDQHTTVIRIGYFVRDNGRIPPKDTPSQPPIDGFAAHVGARTDITFLPQGRIFTDTTLPIRRRSTKMWQTSSWESLDRKIPRSRTLIHRGKYEPFVDGALQHIYRAFQRTKLSAKVSRASDELTALLWWMSSGLCSSIDVYGMAFPQQGEAASRAYWATKTWPGPSVPANNAYLEMYALHAAMRAGLICVHV